MNGRGSEEILQRKELRDLGLAFAESCFFFGGEDFCWNIEEEKVTVVFTCLLRHRSRRNEGSSPMQFERSELLQSSDEHKIHNRKNRAVWGRTGNCDKGIRICFLSSNHSFSLLSLRAQSHLGSQLSQNVWSLGRADRGVLLGFTGPCELKSMNRREEQNKRNGRHQLKGRTASLRTHLWFQTVPRSNRADPSSVVALFGQDVWIELDRVQSVGVVTLSFGVEGS